MIIGILQKATDAKTKSDESQIKEKIRLAYSSALTKDISNQKSEVQKSTFENELAIEFPNKTISIENSTDNKDWIVTIDSVTENVPIGKDTPTVLKVADHKNEKFNTNTELEDSFGNKITVPTGFKITSDSPSSVTEGIIIEDVTYTNTIGGQFVWIPVGTRENAIKKNEEGTETVEIALDRYSFQDSNGTKTGIARNWAEVSTDNGYGQYYIATKYTEDPTYREGSKDDKINATAKELSVFISSVDSKGGFYIGRYEARTATQRTDSTLNDLTITDSNLTQITEKQNDYVYNYVTQLQAAKLSREMYIKDNNSNNITEFASDLMNSYAWDTATLFLQECGEENYSIKSSINKNLEEKGTTTDHPCNIYDTASNCCEWTTETYRDTLNPCVSRGGSYWDSSSFSGFRNSGRTADSSGIGYSFRPILYIK